MIDDRVPRAAETPDRREFLGVLGTTAMLAMLGRIPSPRVDILPRARSVVLVHGLYADGSSWANVIGRLLDVGLDVTSVQNPLTSLADSVAATRRALATQQGPTVRGTPSRSRTGPSTRTWNASSRSG